MTDPAGGESTPVRASHRFDEGRLQEWMAEHVGDFHGPMRVEQFVGGQSNPTFKLITPARIYVLRRQPMGPLLKGAHAVDREAKVLGCLGPLGFPVPPVHALCQDPEVIGSWFYVMDMVPGRIFWDSTFPGVAPESRPEHFDAMNVTLARLHSIDPAAAGLAGFGRPENYLARQIGRWSRQYLDDPQAGRNEHMDKLVEWLPARAPETHDAAIIHGDYRVDNLVFHPHEPRIIAVLDWELSTLGDPVADFTYHLMMYRLPPRISAGLAGYDLAALRIPDEAEYIRRYCSRTGRDGIHDLSFYLAFNMFRFAAILHGIKGRMIRGTAASSKADEITANFDFLAAQAAQLADHAGS
jgi:aminoglycoside phosphotransferase (APT) family kinase protein